MGKALIICFIYIYKYIYKSNLLTLNLVFIFLHLFFASIFPLDFFFLCIFPQDFQEPNIMLLVLQFGSGAMLTGCKP